MDTATTRLPERDRVMALRWLLATSDGRLAALREARSFAQGLEISGLRCDLWGQEAQGGYAAVAGLLRIPGRSSMLLMPSPRTAGIRLEPLTALLRDVVREAARARDYFTQTLLAPDDDERHQLAGEVGLQPLTQLEYRALPPMQTVRVPELDELNLVTWCDANHADFVSVVAASYVGSADCPELTRIRPASDALDSHRATGVFAPENWWIAYLNGELAGCCLLAPLPNTQLIELVYMGVAPAFRGRGLGRALLGHAVRHTRKKPRHSLTLAVDTRNRAARRLYDEFGVAPLARRDAAIIEHNLR